MNIKKMILAIIAVAVFNFIAGMVTCGGAFSRVYKLEPTNVWRPMESVSFPLMIAGMLLVDIVFSNLNLVPTLPLNVVPCK